MSQQKRILVVDDDVNMHEFYSELFGEHAVSLSTSGEDAVALIEKGERFDMIYLDLQLLGMSGFAALDRFKELLGAKLPPVIVSSSLSDPQTRQMAAEKGAVGFVPKPIDLQYAISVAHKLLQG